MTVIKLEYIIQYFEDGTSCFNAAKNFEEDLCSGETYSIEIPKTRQEISEPIHLGVPIQNVTSLLISNCQLMYLPNSFQFYNLIEVDISHNLFKQVPDLIIFNNPNIQKLNISYNKIMDFNLIPKCYKKLQYLNLSNNYMHDIPQWIFNSACTALETLNFSYNPFERTVPLLSGLHLIKLCTLELNNSNVKNYWKFLQEIPFLRKLLISNISSMDYLNTIQELPFKIFNSVKTLTELHFSRLGFSYLNEDICELSALEILNISYNHLAWLPNHFTKLKSLQILDLSHNELLYLPSDIDELKNLQELHLSHNLIGSIPQSLANLNKLKLLDCYSNDLIEDALLTVDSISSLVAFDIEQNSFTTIDDEHYLNLRKNIWNKNGYRISGCKQVDISEDELDAKSSLEDENDTECLYTEGNIKDHEEEVWDCDTDSIGDDSMLVLPPYKFKYKPKPVPYNPSDDIDPLYFEDALEEEM